MMKSHKGYKKEGPKDKWGTPPSVFLPLNLEFNFTLDPCAEPETAKVKKYYTKEDNGLLHTWKGETAFVNPPYSRGNIDKWVRKCYQESKQKGTVVVALLPASTSTKWFHQWVLGKAEIRFCKGRIRFLGAVDQAPFHSIIAIYKNAQ